MAVRGIKKAHFAFTLEFVIASPKLLARVPPSSVILWFCDRESAICAHPSPHWDVSQACLCTKESPKERDWHWEEIGRDSLSDPRLETMNEWDGLPAA